MLPAGTSLWRVPGHRIPSVAHPDAGSDVDMCGGREWNLLWCPAALKGHAKQAKVAPLHPLRPPPSHPSAIPRALSLH